MIGQDSRVAIVGGGVLGMTLALRLRQAGMRPVVIEAAPAPGGLASSDTIGAYQWDRFYHVILKSDLELLRLLDDLGLSDRLRWGYTRTACYAGGRFHPLTTSVDFVRFPLLNPVEKARLAATIVHASRIRDWQRLEGETASAWLTRWSGKGTYQRLWLPLLRSKLGENAERASAAFIWAIIARMYAARRSGLKREMFGYVDGGYALILRRFRERLEQEGVEFSCGTPVAAVRPIPGGVSVRLADGREPEFESALLTVPCRQVGELCPDLSQEERARLQRVVYQGIICPSFLLRQPLGGHYITSITDTWVPFTAVIEMTALVDRERFGGNTLVYLPRYVTQSSALWQRSDAEIAEESVDALLRMYPRLRRSDVVSTRVARARDVLALSTLHYSREALPLLTTSLPGIFVINSAQIAAGTLNVNETVALANRQAAKFLHQVPRRVASQPVGR
jgi:protoporphyrinogen oxidase